MVALSRSIEAITINPENGKPQFNALTCSPLEAARALGIGKDAIYELLRTETLPAQKIGRNFRIPVAAIQEWLAHPAQ